MGEPFGDSSRKQSGCPPRLLQIAISPAGRRLPRQFRRRFLLLRADGAGAIVAEGLSRRSTPQALCLPGGSCHDFAIHFAAMPPPLLPIDSAGTA